QFLTWDHPLVSGALDFLLGSTQGNSSFVVWPDKSVSALYLEVVYVLESVAPASLHVDRFLPPTPLRVIVDQAGTDMRKTVTTQMLSQSVKDSDPHMLIEMAEFRDQLLPDLLGKAQKIATAEGSKIIAASRQAMSSQLESEIRRLQDLQKVNKSVR